MVKIVGTKSSVDSQRQEKASKLKRIIQATLKDVEGLDVRTRDGYVFANFYPYTLSDTLTVEPSRKEILIDKVKLLPYAMKIASAVESTEGGYTIKKTFSEKKS